MKLFYLTRKILTIEYASTTQGPAAVFNALLHFSNPDSNPLLQALCVTEIHISTTPRGDL